MDALKRKKIIIALLVVIIVALAIFFAFRLTDLGQKPGDQEAGKLPEFKAPSANLEFKEIEPTISNDQLLAVQQAMNFAERFGTYSSDQPGENIKQLFGVCTTKMVNYLNQIAIDYQAKSYTGVTTKSISYDLSDFADSQAEVLVHTQRQETRAIDSKLITETVYKDIKINLIKNDKQWLIDGAYWQ